MDGGGLNRYYLCLVEMSPGSRFADSGKIGPVEQGEPWTAERGCQPQ